MHIRLAWPWEGPDGTKHEGGTVVLVDRPTARDLARRGLAAVLSKEDGESAVAAQEAALAAQQDTPEVSEGAQDVPVTTTTAEPTPVVPASTTTAEPAPVVSEPAKPARRGPVGAATTGTPVASPGKEA